MPDPWASHSENKDDWGSNLNHSEEVRRAVNDDPEPPPAGKRKKNTRDWCKGREGRPHEPVMKLRYTALGKPDQCGWGAHFSWRIKGYEVYWYCGHEQVCARCGKTLGDHSGWRARKLRDNDCPVYPSTRERWQAAVLEAKARDEQRAQQLLPWTRRRKITGPTHYRRPKGGGDGAARERTGTAGR